MEDPRKHKYIFTAEDLLHQTEALNEFKTRHTTITDRINETYKIGNQMMEYLEQQIILDHHWRGEQDIFEEEYPHLKEKAEKLLGSDTYFDCSPLTGSPITEDEQPELYARLMKIQKKITSDLDENLAQHHVQLDQFEEDIGSNNESPLNQESDEHKDTEPILTTEDSTRNEPEAKESEEDGSAEGDSKKAKDSA